MDGPHSTRSIPRRVTRAIMGVVGVTLDSKAASVTMRPSPPHGSQDRMTLVSRFRRLCSTLQAPKN